MPIPIVSQLTPSSFAEALTAGAGGIGFGFVAHVGWPGATGTVRDCESAAVAPGASIAFRGFRAASTASGERMSCARWLLLGVRLGLRAVHIGGPRGGGGGRDRRDGEREGDGATLGHDAPSGG